MLDVIIEMKEKDFCNSLRVSVLTIYVYYIKILKYKNQSEFAVFYIIINLFNKFRPNFTRNKIT
jgi:hypothetical protein